MLNEVINMSWGKVNLDAVITIIRENEPRSFVLRPFPHGLLY